MTALSQRMTALEIINEVRRKLKLNPVTSFTADSYVEVMLPYLNDVLAEVSDYGNWQETLREINVTAQSSVADYTVPSSVNVVQNIHEVVFNSRPGEMRLVDLDTIRRLNRTRPFGIPYQWAVVGTDVDANPIFRVSPIPTSAEHGLLFNLVVFEKPAFITTAETSIVPVFPGKLLTQGLFCKMILDESDGEPTSRYAQEKEKYDQMLDESYNRYNGDSGSTIYFRPARGRR